MHFLYPFLHFISGAFLVLQGFFAPIIVGKLEVVNPPDVFVVAPPQATVLFGGDIMLDRTIRTAVYQKGGDFIFSCLDSLLDKPDLVVANLEGPITSNMSISATSSPGDGNNYTFTFSTSTAPLLYAHHIRMLSLGNNHILNFGYTGARSTIASLTQAGILYFGDPIEHRIATTTINGITLVFINYNEFGGSASTTISQIASAKASGDLSIVYTHWGVEYATTSPEYVHTLAHEFVNAGAALVVGSHPHVVEDHEFYNGVSIYYSLGNLIFDQYWSDAVRHGLMLSVIFSTQGVRSIQEIPVELQKDRRTCPVFQD